MDIAHLYRHFYVDCRQKICTDSRRMVPGSMFFALRGETYNGNDYAQKAYELGCRFAVVDDPNLQSKPGMFYVQDVAETLQNLARHHRNQFDIPVVVIAGSNGKTTSKELLTSALSTQKNVVATKGNLNNHIGVPLTVLGITQETDIAVIEAGANHLNELAQLCEIAKPTAGVITNIGRDHLGCFGGVAAVIESNLELYQYLKKHGGHVFVNGSDKALMRYSSEFTRTVYGPDTEGIFKVTERNNQQPFLALDWSLGGSIDTHLVGSYNLDNCAFAITAASHYGILREYIVESISAYQPRNNRSQWYEGSNGTCVFKDFYNANRTSMEAAITAINNIRGSKNLILVLGDMLELGEFSEDEHREVINYALEVQPDKLFLYGPEFQKAATASPVLKTFSRQDDLIQELNHLDMKECVVLIKGSLGMNMDQVFQEVRW